ncbi:MAG: NADH-ubiquinone oxidoreductase-F iron-sulfur binding region domain-containing protein [Acidimicrobiia bacterium]
MLDARPVATLADYTDAGGGRGLDAARRLGPAATIDEVEASGLRGRGGAGFPTGRKWRTVAGYASQVVPSTVVVNAAEGEPGSFKDRLLLRRNPYRVLEGALIAAHAVGADSVVVAAKADFTAEIDRLRKAITELEAAQWAGAVPVSVVEGPSEYLYGEETALLEVVDGRAPLPRIAPPFRHGVDEVGDPSDDEVAQAEGSAADLTLATPGDLTAAPPALVNNTETMANVPGILAQGAAWYRSVGTADSPGTAVCTVGGWTRRSGVGEFPMGTPLSEVISTLGGGPASGDIVAVLSGVANPFLPADRLDTPLTYEALEAAGSGLGAAGFIVFDESVDLVAAAAGVSRFLAVESCGQCTPCKQDGLAMAGLLDGLARGRADVDADQVRDELAARVETVADEARCFLATQQQRVVGSLLSLFPDALAGSGAGGEPLLIAPIVDLVDDQFVLDTGHRDKQPDWTFGDDYSGQSPADRLDRPAPAQAS